MAEAKSLSAETIAKVEEAMNDWKTLNTEERTALKPQLQEVVDVYTAWRTKVEDARIKAIPPALSSSNFYLEDETLETVERLRGKDVVVIIRVDTEDNMTSHPFEVKEVREWMSGEKVYPNFYNHPEEYYYKIPSPDNCHHYVYGCSLENAELKDILMLTPIHSDLQESKVYFDAFSYLYSTKRWPTVWKEKYADYAKALEESLPHNSPVRAGLALTVKEALATL